MINLRYHVVSIAAVFLALGIGLALGSTLLERVTVESLARQLDTIELQVERARDENARISEDLERLRRADAELAERLPEELLGDRLEGVSVLLVATEGTEQELVRRAERALGASGAEIAGAWWLRDRWALEGGADAADLASALGLDPNQVDRVRRSAVAGLSEVLAMASRPPGRAFETPGGAPREVAPPAEPPLVAALRAAGFVDYDGAPGDGVVRLPAGGLRVLVVSDLAPGAPAQGLLVDLLRELSAEGTASVVAGESGVRPGGAGPELDRVSFVGDLRAEAALNQRVSTVDHLELAAGLAAAVMALEDLEYGVVGHYGLGEGAGRVLPAQRR